MGINYIYQKCSACSGTGKQIKDSDNDTSEVEIECSNCGGNGVIYWGELHDEKIGEE